jgi:hypothetical protein
MSNWKGQRASRLGRSIVTQVATAQTNATQFTTPFAADLSGAGCPQSHRRDLGDYWLDCGRDG